ncbi:MAG: DegT/DnrJ/EryC1/StrS family aminotransferase [Acidobacteria bacterium]|nr:DegT/DnrJ/EryC1/StrS family aminotransferase [Acidobacteriota bacterium]
MIRLTVPSIDREDLDAVAQVLASGFLIQGAKVAEFEEKLRAETGTRYVIAVSSGTAALHLALLALGVGPGDLVLVTAYSWISTANVIELCGAQPVFVDIQPDTFNMDPVQLARLADGLMNRADTAQRLKAILPIDAFGLIADMPAIQDIAKRYELPVVEDAACALGARLHQKPAGAYGTLGTFSLHPRKAVTTGEGGAVATNEDGLAWKVKALRNHGLDPAASAPDFVLPGFNYRMTEFQAALGITQLKKLRRIVEQRRRLAANYDRLLAGTEVVPPGAPPGSEPACQSYVCLLPSRVAPARAELIAALKEKGVETTIGTWHMPLTSYFRKRYGFRPGDFPVADQVFARTLSLPLYEGLRQQQQETVVSALRDLIAP